MKLTDFRQQLTSNSNFVETEQKLSQQFTMANDILRARLRKGWSPLDLAKAINVEEDLIIQIESGLIGAEARLMQKIMSASKRFKLN